MLKYLSLSVIIFAVLAAGTAFAGSFEDAQRGARKGDPKAQYALAVMYQNGTGTTQDYTKALEFYQKSADQGYVEAQYKLGFLYFTGEEIIQNYKKLLSHFRKPRGRASGAVHARCDV
jgi:TPR repeat protein